MSDPAAAPEPAVAGSTSREELCGRISRSLSSVWQHHAGTRPGSLTTNMRGSVVKCTVTAGEALPDAEPGDGDPADPADGRSTDSRGYKEDAIRAVSRATHRRVMAFIRKQDPEGGGLTETYILRDEVRRL